MITALNRRVFHPYAGNILKTIEDAEAAKAEPMHAIGAGWA